MIRSRSFMPVVAAVLVGAATLVAPTRAHAALSMTLEASGASALTIVDNDANDNNPLVGQIGYNQLLGDFNRTNINAATSNSTFNEIPAELTISATETTTDKTGATLKITVQDTVFNVPSPGPASVISELANVQITGTNVTGTSITFQSFIDNSGGTLVGTNQPDGLVATDTLTIGTTPYTLKNVTMITIGTFTSNTATVIISGITSVSPVPEPGAVALALSGIPCLGIASWLRRRKKA